MGGAKNVGQVNVSKYFACADRSKLLYMASIETAVVYIYVIGIGGIALA